MDKLLRISCMLSDKLIDGGNEQRITPWGIKQPEEGRFGFARASGESIDDEIMLPRVLQPYLLGAAMGTAQLGVSGLRLVSGLSQMLIFRSEAYMYSIRHGLSPSSSTSASSRSRSFIVGTP